MPKDRASKRLKAQQARVARERNESAAVLRALTNIFGASQHPALADPREPPSISEEWHPELWAAFQYFGRDPRQNMGWWLLAMDMAEVLFPQPGKPGRPQGSRKWNGDRLFVLYHRAIELQNEHPAWNMRRVCVELKKDELFSNVKERTLYGLLTKRPKK